jgi:hypothetical protein
MQIAWEHNPIRVSKLCSIGYKLMDEDERYKNILNEFIMQYSA